MTTHYSSRYLYLVLYFFFFFQAEDGIRDVAVTGVQTCALPISLDRDRRRRRAAIGRLRRVAGCPEPLGRAVHGRAGARSEEHTSELQSRLHLVCRLLLEKKKKISRRNNGQHSTSESAAVRAVSA